MYDYDDYDSLDEREPISEYLTPKEVMDLLYREEHAVRAAQLGGIEGVPGGETVENHQRRTARVRRQKGRFS